MLLGVWSNFCPKNVYTFCRQKHTNFCGFLTKIWPETKEHIHYSVIFIYIYRFAWIRENCFMCLLWDIATYIIAWFAFQILDMVVGIYFSVYSMFSSWIIAMECVFFLFSDGEFMVLGMAFFIFPDDLFFPISIWTFLSLFYLDF